MYILLKLKPGSLPLAIELHQPGIHFYHVLKKAPSINQFKSLLDKDPNLLVHLLIFTMMSNAIGKLKHSDSDSLFTKFYNKESVSKVVSIQT